MADVLSTSVPHQDVKQFTEPQNCALQENIKQLLKYKTLY